MSTAGSPRELDVAYAAATAAGKLLVEHFARGVQARWKAPGDPVTVADHEAEQTIRDHLADAFGGDLVVGEEEGAPAERLVRGRRRWYVDPLDGTINFLKQRSHWATSIAFCDADDRMTVGVVHAPLIDETFTAVAGGGAWCDGRRLARPSATEPRSALVALGGLGRPGDRRLVGRISDAVLSVRIHGSTTLDLCEVADGRADAFLASRAGRWDLAAGALIAREAGARVTDLGGAELTAGATEVLAAAPGLHEHLLALTRAGAQGS